MDLPVNAYDRQHITDLIHTARDVIVKRGYEYLVSGRIVEALMDFRQREARFKVQGSAEQPYNVVIKDITSPAISVSCDCPYDKAEPCKHAVAALFYLRENFDRMLDEYNKRYYPSLPLQPDVQALESYIDRGKRLNPEEYDFGRLLYLHNYVSLVWLNPYFQLAELDVDGKRIVVEDFSDWEALSFTCECEKENCRHSYAAAYFLKEILQSEAYSSIEQKFLREKGKVLVGRIKDIKPSNVEAHLPQYFPQVYELKSLRHNFISFNLKVRYQYVDVAFEVKDNKIYAKCSCDDNVRGLCKHQIAALNMLLEMDKAFFYFLASKEYIRDLKQMFV